MKFLFRPIDIASLAFFRVIFGILAFADVTSTLTYRHWYKGQLDPSDFHYKYYGFEWVTVFGDPWMSLFLLSLMISGICIAVGYRYRLFMTYFAFGFSYTFLLEKVFYLNHGYLLVLLSYLMIFMPAHRNFSFDIFRRPKIYLERIPYWPVFLLKFMMGVVYFFGGIAKLNGDWFRAQPLKIWLQAKSKTPIIGGLLENDMTAYCMSYGGLILDLFVVFFLLSARTRKWAFGFVLFFHFTNVIIFEIGVFPWLSITLTALYFAPDFPRRVYNYLERKISRLSLTARRRRWLAKLEKHGIIPDQQALVLTDGKKKTVALLIGLYCLIQLLIPLRHHTFKGPVAWTEEGHRYSWRMMLRGKRGKGHFIVKDGVTGKEERINLLHFLSVRQKHKLYGHPDMILQFAHYIRDKYEAEGMQNVEIYAHIKTKLNDRDYQKYVDETVDLAKVEWNFFKTKKWIVELKEE